MKQVHKLKNLETLAFFNIVAVEQVTEVSAKCLYENISRWIKSGTLIQLKKGLYTTKSYYSKVEDKESYTEFIANKLKYPSYLSLEYVLSKYQILSENVYTYTSVTSKKTNIYSSELGVFSYRNISDKLFVGFEIINKGGFEVVVASKAKALFDYLYFKFYKQKKITEEDINGLRLNLDEFSEDEVKELQEYCNLTSMGKFKNLTKLLFEKNDY